jgi:hypothetical protein
MNLVRPGRHENEKFGVDGDADALGPGVVGVGLGAVALTN